MPKIQQKVTSNRTRISPFSKNESQKQSTPKIQRVRRRNRKKEERNAKKKLALKKKQEKEKNVLELMLKQRAEILELESYTVTKRPKKRIK